MGGSHDVLGVAPIHRLNKLDASPAFIIEKKPRTWALGLLGCRLVSNLVERHLQPAEDPDAAGH